MRTTIEINDELFRAAKSYAAQRSLTLRSLVETALRDALETKGQQGGRSQPPVIPSYSGSGLQPGVDLTDNAALLDAMDAKS